MESLPLFTVMLGRRSVLLTAPMAQAVRDAATRNETTVHVSAISPDERLVPFEIELAEVKAIIEHDFMPDNVIRLRRFAPA